MAETQSFWSQRQKYEPLMLPAVSVVVVLLLTVLVLIPQVRRLVVDFREIGELRERVRVLSEKAVVLGNLDRAELAVRSSKLSQALPSDEDLGYFLTAIRSMARRSGSQFNGVELLGRADVEQPIYAEGVPQAARKRVPLRQKEDAVLIAVILQGEVAALQQFLLEVERSIPLASLTELFFGGERGASELTAKLTLKYFYSPLPETIGVRAQPLQVITGAEEQVYDQLAEFAEPEVVELPRVPTGNKDLIL